MGEETEGRRGCKVRRLKADMFLKIYTVYEMRRTVASFLLIIYRLQPTCQSLQDVVIFTLISDFIQSYR